MNYFHKQRKNLFSAFHDVSFSKTQDCDREIANHHQCVFLQYVNSIIDRHILLICHQIFDLSVVSRQLKNVAGVKRNMEKKKTDFKVYVCYIILGIS